MSTQNPVYSDPEQNFTGSSKIDEPVYLTIGYLGKAHGLNGEIIMYLTTDFPERIRTGKIVFLGKDYRPITIGLVRRHQKGLILKFDGIDTIEEVELLSKETVYVKTDSLPDLPAGEYYHHQLLGMNVFDESGNDIGILTEILETGANDVYVITGKEGKEELIPALKQNLLNTDVKNKTMVVKLLNYFNQD
ncbi:MAG: 16S rRNA processing protein RimM [Chloroflexi bacterium HGW-Chloroflexi-8]|nr:MAG: 16S rRNA processing protein RimM [Chloroflexi bacterium HGW-Chloroflexi-8]